MFQPREGRLPRAVSDFDRRGTLLSMFHGNDIKAVIKRAPFELVRIAFSDGRSVVIKHPDQVVVTPRHTFVGLARAERTPPLVTPEDGDTIARGWMLISNIHVTAIDSTATRSVPARQPTDITHPQRAGPNSSTPRA